MNLRNPARGLAIATLIALVGAATASAAPVTIGGAFLNVENSGPNSLGLATGPSMRIGAGSVIPNGSAGTVGTATATSLLTGQPVTVGIPFAPNPVTPNFFVRTLPFGPNIPTTWTMTFTNGSDSSFATVSLPPGTQPAPRVETITLSGTALEPTFTWTPPAGTTVNGYRINIIDRTVGAVVSRNFAPDTTSYTVRASDFSIPGYAFSPDTQYTIEIALLQSRDGTSNGLNNNANLLAIARAYADFTPRTTGGPAVILPVVNIDGAYQFDFAVLPGQTYYIDPEVAIGYDYSIGSGDPNFRSVVLPIGIGDGLYDLYRFGAGNSLELLVAGLAGGAVYDFGTFGLDRFAVRGIETSAGLDPANTTAFVTGLTFAGAGRFTGLQTPVTVEVPLPSSLALLAVGAFVASRRRWVER